MARLVIEKQQKAKKNWNLPKRIGAKDRARSLRQLATLVQMHIPLEQALTLVSRQLQNRRLQAVYLNCREKVRNGESLAVAMQHHPRIFGDNVYHLVMVGELTGHLGKTLDQAARQMEKVLALKRKMVTALSYPAIVLLVAFAAVAFLLTVVVPTFNEVFKDFGGDMPFMTRLLVNSAEIISRRWYLVVLAIILFFWLVKQSWRHAKTRIKMEGFIFRFPVLGAVIFKTHLARLVRTLSTLLANGIQLVTALPASGQASGSLVLMQAADRMNVEVQRGVALYQSLAREKVFPLLISQMAEIGEQSGSLSAMMEKAAIYYEEEIDTAIDNLNAVLEPLLIVGLGVVLGGILIALYMQIFSLVDVVH